MAGSLISHPENDSINLVFASGGQAGALMRSLDWTQTPLGGIDR